jgi:hypothetical protein
MTPRRAVLVALALTLVAACSEETTSSPETAATDAGTTTSAATTTTTAATTTTTTTTTTLPPTTLAPTTTASTTSTTTTTVSRAVEELVLRPDGIGQAAFGADPDGVIEYFTSILGQASGDTGWIDPFTFALCPGTVVRRVEWGVLSLLFSDDSAVTSGRRHFFAWEYGLAGQIGDEPQGLRTPGGTTLGSRVLDLRAEFPEVVVNEGDDGGGVPPNFYVSDDYRGLLTGATDDDLVTVMFGGVGCGE